MERATIVSGNRADREGGARGASGAERVGPYRILCIKLDHIGDMLIAIPALAALRASFPKAHISLICAPWNVALARRFGIVDDVIELEFFSQISMADLNGRSPDQQRQAALEAVERLGLGRFDLAIDLRRDEDTRVVLKLVDASARVGFGDVATFSYLDAALPYVTYGPAAGLTELALGPQELDSERIHRTTEYGLHLVIQNGKVDLTISTDCLWAPSEDGQPDFRPLGVAFGGIASMVPAPANSAAGDEQPPRPSQIERDRIRFAHGWLEWEEWGRWTCRHHATLSFDVAVIGPEIDLVVRLQGHTAPKFPQALVTVGDGHTQATHLFRAGDGPSDVNIRALADVQRPVARSRPHLLRAGHYDGRLRVNVLHRAAWQRLTLVVRTARLGRVIACLQLPAEAPGDGPIEFPFSLDLLDASEPLVVEVEAVRADQRLGLAIAAVELRWRHRRIAPSLPGHMEQQLLDLIAVTASRYAPPDRRAVPRAVVERGIRRSLTRGRRGSTAAAPAQRLRRKGMWSRRRVMVGLGMGANKETKLWPAAYFVTLCRRLLESADVDVVLIGGPREVKDAAALVAAVGDLDRVVNLVAACRIEDLGELLAPLDAYIGLDTGTTHFAGRIGVPTLALFGASHDPREWGPVGERASWVRSEVGCWNCSYSQANQCGASLMCMTDLTPDAIWSSVEAILPLSTRRRLGPAA